MTPSPNSTWNTQSIRRALRENFPGAKIIVVSNCEPFSHSRDGNRLTWSQPASGLVSALEPVLRASGGTWIASGDGEADRAAADMFGRVRVPPDAPAYTLRRVWLDYSLKRDYYQGAANESIWPACHLVFHRPRFSESCWHSYRRVNEIFADAVLQEAAGGPAVVLVQDYHFALLPRILKARRPDLIVGQFWHIPWPAPEHIRILPWRREVLLGMLGNDLLGFHLQEHCSGFLDAVGRLGGRFRTAVRAFPIGIDFDAHTRAVSGPEVQRGMDSWRQEIGPAEILGIGIDRIDYIKGIPERLAAVDALFEEHPEYIGRVVFVQVGVPSRGAAPAYRALQEEIAALVASINARWGSGGWKPIVYIDRRVDQSALRALHLLADFCVISSLHDGMNLVAKEFVASRIDEDGVLVLSEFAGASQELSDALIMNPFCIREITRAIDEAIRMPAAERRRRMVRMRRAVAQRNIYRWGAEFLDALAEARQESYERRVALTA
jgi:trehalose 6-phosphate synthase